MSDFYKKIIDNNKKWVEAQIANDPEYFKDLSKGQNPPLLWIGCSDSRVTANEIIGAKPGEVFVHRNIANLVVHTDFNFLSVLQYALEVLKVKHIIVCGHYGCGGIATAMSHKSLGLINKWLRHIKDIYRFHEKELLQIEDPDARRDRLVELNVCEQVHNIAETSIVQEAWALEKRPMIHGWVYDMKTGLLKELVNFEPGAEIEDIYRFDY